MKKIDMEEENSEQEIIDELKRQKEILKEDNEELDFQNEKLSKSKSFFFGTTVILLIVVLILGGSSLYLYKRSKKSTKVIKYEYTKAVKNEIINKFHPNDEFVENYHNAQQPLKLGNTETDTDPTHPKVINFEEKWNGYKYWMVYSPYPQSDDSKENPHIRASNDLINWEVPKGLENPIVGPPKNYKRTVTYYSDPHLVYNNDTDELECYFRAVDDTINQVILYRMKSKDGVKWSKKEEIIKMKRSTGDVVSPAIIYDNGTYKIWYVYKNYEMCYAESEDGLHYSDCKKVSLTYPYSVRTWHLDVIKTEKGYEMITVAFYNPISDKYSERNFMNLYYFNSENETEFGKGMTILKPSMVSWDNLGLYRSSFIYEDGVYYVFYSGISSNFDRGIGLSYGEHIENLIGSNLEPIKKK